MGFFKRLCLFLFGLAGLLALTALVLPWYGPWTVEATALLGVDEYYMAVEVLVLITGLGCLVCLLRSIFKRNRKTVVVSQQGGDQITVARDAISSQATHVIEEDGTFKAKRVSVWAKKRGHVRVYARVQPQMTVDTVRAGEELHDKLVAGLTTVCGDNVDSVDLEFTNAAEYAPSSDAYQYDYDYTMPAQPAEATEPAPSEPAATDAAAAPDPATTADAGEKGEGTAVATGPGAMVGAAAEAPATDADAMAPAAEDTDDAEAHEPAGDALAEKGEDAASEEGSEITVPMGRYAGKGSEPTGEE
jgi:hypothetical protein